MFTFACPYSVHTEYCTGILAQFRFFWLRKQGLHHLVSLGAPSRGTAPQSGNFIENVILADLPGRSEYAPITRSWGSVPRSRSHVNRNTPAGFSARACCMRSS